ERGEVRAHEEGATPGGGQVAHGVEAADEPLRPDVVRQVLDALEGDDRGRLGGDEVADGPLQRLRRHRGQSVLPEGRREPDDRGRGQVVVLPYLDRGAAGDDEADRAMPD